MLRALELLAPARNADIGIAAIDAATAELNNVMQAASQKMYQAGAQPGAQAGPDMGGAQGGATNGQANQGTGSSSAQDNAQDADFEEVK